MLDGLTQKEIVHAVRSRPIPFMRSKDRLSFPSKLTCEFPNLPEEAQRAAVVFPS